MERVLVFNQLLENWTKLSLVLKYSQNSIQIVVSTIVFYVLFISFS